MSISIGKLFFPRGCTHTHDLGLTLFGSVWQSTFAVKTHLKCRKACGGLSDPTCFNMLFPAVETGGTWKAHQHDHADGLLQAQRITQLFICCFYIGFLMPPSCDSHRAQTARCAMCLPNIGNLAGKPTDSCHLL